MVLRGLKNFVIAVLEEVCLLVVLLSVCRVAGVVEREEDGGVAFFFVCRDCCCGGDVLLDCFVVINCV